MTKEQKLELTKLWNRVLQNPKKYPDKYEMFKSGAEYINSLAKRNSDDNFGWLIEYNAYVKGISNTAAYLQFQTNELRKKRRNENYLKLRKIGFSAKQATKMKNWSRKTVNRLEALKEKVDEKKLKANH